MTLSSAGLVPRKEKFPPEDTTVQSGRMKKVALQDKSEHDYQEKIGLLPNSADRGNQNPKESLKGL